MEVLLLPSSSSLLHTSQYDSKAVSLFLIRYLFHRFFSFNLTMCYTQIYEKRIDVL